ncbi:condensation domain-containing protein [Streptomyces beijiangensis]|uniref:Peptide synthase condensation domain-containing protein n=1 Tax=Streptomyces beijiangensis TaxID=163361 RepID=A0A939JC02_9ACTN|nr:condensation domain-containing protein [Streptomyces beijiangensis]MBO0510496.1 peptide synthase condensation domain-containing protein [Streptomyces beijiangensis]
MATSPFARLPQDQPITAVVEFGDRALPVLELYGPVDAARVEAAFGSIAARYPGEPAWTAGLESRRPGRHTLRFTGGTGGAEGTGGSVGEQDEFPLGALADLLTRGGRGSFGTRRLAATPLQRELLADADAHPAPGRQVEQAAWDWRGPLDVERFTAAWHSVFARESVLRTAFDDRAEPGLLVYDEARPQVVRLPHGSAEWHSLIEADRRTGIDPRRPAPLRVTLLGGGPAGSVRPPAARVLLTYHHALLDSWSVRLLVREFYRAYLAGGELPGGERRPDMTDYAAWLATRSTAAAEDYFTSTGAGGPAPVPPLFTATATRTAGRAEGRSRLRLTRQETARLARWAAQWGGSESIALEAVWTLLLYRAGRAEGPSPVRFATTATGRSIPFEGVERTPGALAGPLPRSVLVDPGATVPQLVSALRDHSLDQAAHEWVSAGQIHRWTGPPPPPADTLLTFEAPPRVLTELEAELAASGVEVEPPQTLGAHTAFPVTLIAHHDGGGRLVLTASYDQVRLPEITWLLAHAAVLLRELPQVADQHTTVGEALALLSGLVSGGAVRLPPADPADTTDPADSAGTAAAPAVLRRAAHADAGTVGLLEAPGVSRDFYDRLARAYEGPEELLLFGPVPAGGPQARAAARAVYDVLGPRATPGGGPAVAAFSGDGAAVCAVARLAVADGHRPLAVVLDGTGTDPGALARVLASAVGRRRRH